MRKRLLAVATVVLLSGTVLAAGASGAKFDGGSGSVACGSGTIAFSPAKLWPPNHKLRDVTFTSATPFAVTGVTHDEEGTEKGSTAENEPDFVITDAAGGTAEGDNAVVQLRAERLGKPKDGRSYTVALSCTSGDVISTASATITVPHSRKKS